MFVGDRGVRRFRRCIGGDLVLPEGVMTGGTIGF